MKAFLRALYRGGVPMAGGVTIPAGVVYPGKAGAKLYFINIK